MRSLLRVRASTATVVTVTALTALSACGGGGDKTPDGGTVASRDDNAPNLNGTALFTFMSGDVLPEGIVTATVPGLNSTTVDVMSSKPTVGTFPGATDIGTQHSSPEGKALVAYGVKLHDATQLPSGKDYTLSLIADDKTVHSEPVSSDAISDGKGFLTAVPADAKITVRLSADNGQQNVTAGTTTRDDKTSNGLPLTAKVNLPVASAKSCDAPAKASESSKALACHGLSYTWTDHSEDFGWAPPGKAWLTVHASSTYAPIKSADDGNFLGEPGWGYGTLSTLDLSNTRLGENPLKWQNGLETLNLIFPLSKDAKASTITGTASWTDGRARGISGTGTVTITGRTTTPVKYSPPFM